MTGSAFDAGNLLLAESPAHLAVTVSPDRTRLMVTVRTPSTTLSVMLDKACAAEWGSSISEGARELAGPGLNGQHGA